MITSCDGRAVAGKAPGDRPWRKTRSPGQNCIIQADRVKTQTHGRRAQHRLRHPGLIGTSYQRERPPDSSVARCRYGPEFSHGLQDLCTVVRWTLGDIGGPKAGHEAQLFVEGMHPWVRSPTLHEHMMAVARQCVLERGSNDGAAVPAAG